MDGGLISMAILLVNSGALMLLGSIRSDVKHLRKSDEKLESRVTALEAPLQPVPIEPDLRLPVARRTRDDDGTQMRP